MFIRTILGVDTPSQADVTRLLVNWTKGDRSALDALLPAVYNELHRLARRQLSKERSDHTLQSTALVHEAYLRLVDQDVEWQSRAHFFAVASQVIRHILVDHARTHNAGKRGGGAYKLTLDEALAVPDRQRDINLVALDDALKELSELDPQQGRVVELRFFGGLSIEETAEVVGVSPATVKRDWAIAKAWLYRQLSAKASAGSGLQ